MVQDLLSLIQMIYHKIMSWNCNLQRVNNHTKTSQDNDPDISAVFKTKQKKTNKQIMVSKWDGTSLTILIKQLDDRQSTVSGPYTAGEWLLRCVMLWHGPRVGWGRAGGVSQESVRAAARRGGGRMERVTFSSSTQPRSSGTHTGKPLELCTSERPEEGEESRRVQYNLIYKMLNKPSCRKGTQCKVNGNIWQAVLS